MSWGVSPWFILFGTLGFLDLGDYFLPYYLKYFLMTFLFVFFFWDSYDSNVGAFNPFMFNVIIDKYDPIAIYFIVLGLGLYALFVFPV